MKPFAQSRRRLIAFTVVAGLVLASCGGDGERSRNVETIAATPCTKKGTTKTVSKVNYVCGTTPTGKIWFSVVGKLTTKGAKACKPLGKYEAAKSRVCGTVKKSNAWVKVAPLPAAVSGVGGATTLPSTETNVSQSSTTTVAPPSESAAGQRNEVAAALTPAPQPTTIEEFLELPVPRPVEAQAIPAVPTSLKVDGGADSIANGEVFDPPFAVTILDQNGEAFASAGITVVVTPSRSDIELTNAVAKTNDKGVATFDNLRVDGVAGAAVLNFATSFATSVGFDISLNPGPGIRLGLGNDVRVVAVGEPFPVSPRVGIYDKDNNLVRIAGAKIAATYNGKVLQQATIGSTGYAEFRGLQIDTKLTTTDGTKAKIEYSAVDASHLEVVVQNLDLVAGDAASLVVVTQPAKVARAGLILDMQPAVRFVDKNGNPVGKQGQTVVAELVCPPAATCTMSGKRTVETDVSGIARFTDLVISGVAGTYQIVFFSELNSLATISDSVALSAGAAVSIVATKITRVFRHGVKVEAAFELQAIDQWNNPATDFEGELEIATTKSLDFEIPRSSKFVKGALKLDATLRGAAGSVTFRFLSGDRTSMVYEASLVAGVPATIEILTKPGTVSAGNTFSQALIARFRDSADNIVEVSDRPIKLTMSGATTFEETALTNVRGAAVFSITKLTKAGTTGLSYVDPVGDAASATDTITVVAGAPYTTRLVSTAKTYERSGASFAIKPVVQLVDADGNNVATPNVMVTATINFGCGASRLVNNTATSDSNGRVTFTNLVLTGAECAFIIGFRPKDGVGPGLLTVVLSFGAPSTIQISTQPVGARNRLPLTTQPVVILKDSAGNTSKTKDVIVSATLDGLTVSTKTDSDGRATFVGLTASGKTGLRSVKFRSDGLADATSESFLMSAGVATQLVPSEASISVSQGGDLPYLKIKDADGNDTDLAESVIVDASSTSGVAWVSGLRVRTALSGIVSFLGAKVSSSSTSAKLKFTVSGRSMTTTVDVSFTRELRVGDLGPTGGVIIADLNNEPAIPGFRALPVADLSEGGRFVEVAPKGWNGDASDPVVKWGTRNVPTTSNSRFSSNLSSRGGAASNSRQYLDYLKTLTPQPVVTKSAIEIVAEKFAFDVDDWVLPTAGEVSAMLGIAKNDNSKLGVTFSGGVATYWSSTYDFSRFAPVKGIYSQSTSIDDYDSANVKSQSTMLSIRPVRYFG